MGIRLDASFAIPCCVLPFLFSRPCRVMPVLAFGIGLLPGLIILSVTNYLKFGVMSPLSYGGLIAPRWYFAFVPVSMMVVIIAWLLSWSPIQTHIFQYRKSAVFVLLGMILVVLMMPSARHAIRKYAHHVYQIVIDLRVRPWYLWEPSLSRSPGGGMVYADGLKKSFS